MGYLDSRTVELALIATVPGRAGIPAYLGKQGVTEQTITDKTLAAYRATSDLARTIGAEFFAVAHTMAEQFCAATGVEFERACNACSATE